jgi:ABC-type glycerol-3-phosphate transport system permease component
MSAISKTDQTAEVTRPHSRSRVRSDVFITILLGILAFLTFLPVLMLVQLSLKDLQQMADSMWLPVLPFNFKNYVRAFAEISPYMLNSVVFVLGTVSVSILCSTLSAYAFARYNFPGREFLYIAVLALLMIPGVLTLITTFVVAVSLKLNNTMLGIWLPLAAGVQAFQITVLRTFFGSLPQELFEAARLDGASEKRMLLSIALPLSKPMLLTLVVLQSFGVWNEYIWPIMVLSKPELYPVIIGVLRLGEFVGGRDPGAQYAGYVLAGLPMLLLFIFTSRAFIRGLTSGAIKM